MKKSLLISVIIMSAIISTNAEARTRKLDTNNCTAAVSVQQWTAYPFTMYGYHSLISNAQGENVNATFSQYRTLDLTAMRADALIHTQYAACHVNGCSSVRLKDSANTVAPLFPVAVTLTCAAPEITSPQAELPFN